MEALKLSNPTLNLKNLIFNTTNLGNLTNRNNNSISKKLLSNYNSHNNYSMNSTGFSFNIKKNRSKKKRTFKYFIDTKKKR